MSSYSPDLVYSRSLIPLTLSLSRGYHGIYEAHTVPQRWLYEQILRFTTRLESYRGTVFISEPLREKFLNQGIHPRETPSLVAPDGVNLDKFQHPDTVPNDHHRLDLEKRIALYCGSLLPGRGIEEVLLPVMEQVDGWELVLVGGKTEQVERLKSHVRESDSVMVLGHRPHREIPWFLQQADALLMPYQESVSIRDHDETTEEYMSPLKLFEYLAAGKPILSSDLPVLRQVLSHEENALLLPPDQPAEWAGALTRIQRDDDLSKQLSRNAYRDAERYSWTNRARSVMSKFFSS